MEKILIMADTAADITREEVEEFGIRLMPLHVTYEGRTLLEFHELDCRDYWKDLARLDTVPSTAQVTPNEFLNAYREAADEGYTHILLATISSTGSGTYMSASIARGWFEEERPGALVIDIVDSLGYCRVEGDIALHAAELIRGGGTYAEALALAHRLSRSLEAVFWVYSLRQMRKSGRIGGVAGFVGEALGMRPVLRVWDGKVLPVDRARGHQATLQAGLKQIEAFMDGHGQDMALLHADVPEEDIVELETQMRERFHPTRIRRCPIGCSVTTNTGPHALGAAFIGRLRP